MINCKEEKVRDRMERRKGLYTLNGGEMFSFRVYNGLRN